MPKERLITQQKPTEVLKPRSRDVVNTRAGRVESTLTPAPPSRHLQQRRSTTRQQVRNQAKDESPNVKNKPKLSEVNAKKDELKVNTNYKGTPTVLPNKSNEENKARKIDKKQAAEKDNHQNGQKLQKDGRKTTTGPPFKVLQMPKPETKTKTKTPKNRSIPAALPHKVKSPPSRAVPSTKARKLSPRKQKKKPSNTKKEAKERTKLPEAEEEFDLIEINITIYSVSGIVSARKKKKSRKVLSRGFKNGLGSKSISSGPSRATSHGSTAACTIDSSDSGETGRDDGIPTTAVISCKRQAVNSNSVVETFLPSLPLSAISVPGNSFSARYNAHWTSTQMEKRDVKENDPSTFKVVRRMTRESFRPDVKAEQIGIYVNEIVDLQVCLGHGKDMIMLGASSLVVTGEEEGEVFMNLPLRQLTKVQLAEAKSQKKISCNTAFPHDSKTEYSLDENAAMKVGIRVEPYDQVERKDQTRAVKETTDELVGDVLSQLLEGKYVIEIDDENSIIANYLRNDREGEIPNKTLSPQARVPGIFCSPLQFCVDELGLTASKDEIDLDKPPGQQAPKPSEEEREKKKPAEAIVLPFDLVSSVSESLDESETAFLTPRPITPKSPGFVKTATVEKMVLLEAHAPFEI